jgi:hypothetical protein
MQQREALHLAAGRAIGMPLAPQHVQPDVTLRHADAHARLLFVAGAPHFGQDAAA